MENKLWCKLGALTQSKGSATFCEEKSVMLASIHGPSKASGQGWISMDRKGCVKCIYKSDVGHRSDIIDKSKATFIRNICESAIALTMYPRTSISVNIQEIQYPEYMFSSAINAVCLACLNAGLYMNYLFAAVTCYLINDNEIILSSESIENKKLRAICTYVFNNTNYDVIANDSIGSVNQLDNFKCINTCREHAKIIFNFFKESIKNK